MKKSGKSSLFLMELMIALLIFAVCACVCASIIANAWVDIRESRDMGNAVIIAQNEAELIKGGLSKENKTVYFDDKLSETAQENAVYSVVSTIGEADEGVTEYLVEVFRLSDDKLIYTVNSAFYSS